MAGTCKGFFRLILFLCFEGRLHWNSWKASKEKEKDRMELFFCLPHIYSIYPFRFIAVLKRGWWVISVTFRFTLFTYYLSCHLSVYQLSPRLSISIYRFIYISFYDSLSSSLCLSFCYHTWLSALHTPSLAIHSQYLFKVYGNTRHIYS